MFDIWRVMPMNIGIMSDIGIRQHDEMNMFDTNFVIEIA
jgi:hypothetical protein